MTTTNAAGAQPASGAAASSGSNTQAKNDPASKEMFLQLLVAQIKNQNPLNPTDGVQFLTQLAQFTQLEQTVGIRTDLAAVRADLESRPPAAASQTATGSAQ